MKNPTLEGILRRAKEGTHENTPCRYLPAAVLLDTLRQKTTQIDKMRVESLAPARKAVGLARSLDDYKRLTIAIGSGRVERVNALVSVALWNRAAVRGIIDLYERAASGLYKPHGYSQEELLRTYLLLKLGGARVAEVAHRSMNAPSISTARKYAPVTALRASPAAPKLDEIMYNIDVACACLVQPRPDHVSEDENCSPVEGYVGMLDEIKIQATYRWDPDTNTILGPCREHVQDPARLEFSTMAQAFALFEKVNKGEMHLSSEATVAAVGLLSDNPQRSSARPVMFSGTCKRKKAGPHAKVINTFTTACKNKIDILGSARLYCLASDGELRQGSALAEITMRFPLSPSSSIYPLLSPLRLMNHLVGPDDLTSDKDTKHVHKRLRNTLMREGGIFVFGTQITPSLVRHHLLKNGVASTRVDSLLDPNDKQDVPLALSLLREIWQLPSPSVRDQPGFARVQQALNTLGVLFQLLVLPYTNVNLSLSTQLQYLSAAAHLCLILFRDGAAQSRFLPDPLYADIAIMIKNVFYCVAKTKVDNPSGKFWLILLGTDRLETCFGLLRTMVGSDSNVDMLQLGSRLSNVNVCANILAEHPEWGGVSRRLKVPSIEYESGTDVCAAFDHISPQVWKGDVAVENVELSAAWHLGRELLQALLPERSIQALIYQLDQDPSIDIFSPFGQLLVKSPLLYTSDVEPVLATQQVDLSLSTEAAHQEGIDQELDLEDIIATSRAKSDPERAAPYVDGPNDTKLHKARLLRDAALYSTLRDSKDRLARIAGRSRYKVPSEMGNVGSNIITHGSLFGRPQLLLNDPAAILVQCQSHVFLAIVQISSIKHNNRLSGRIPIDMLQEEGIHVGFQLLELTPILDPTVELASEHLDWSWSGNYLPITDKCLGRFVQPIDPVLSTKDPHQVSFLFRSSELQAIAASLYAQLAPDDKRHLPTVSQSASFPYSISKKACFVCESEGETIEREPQDASHCMSCSAQLNRTASQRILEHFGGHILFDPAVQRSDEPCGLCPRPTSDGAQCRIYLLPKAKGSKNVHQQVDLSRSTGCPNMRKFNYGAAAEYKANSPCTNVPIQCPRCPDNAPCVWKYNLEAHLQRAHPHAPIEAHVRLFTLSQGELDSMQGLWNKQAAQSKHKKPKSKPITPSTITISEEHSFRHALRIIDSEHVHGTGDGDNLEHDLGSVSDPSSQRKDSYDNIRDDNEIENEETTTVVQPAVQLERTF
ncbi:hypothetical protein FRC07_012920 [Ceratobasidium sp. 392]|nr:hypothetical protein FRC07_012920 [Ceratobasidium sp. 392]